MMHIVCLSNLAWERTLFQRPQQLMSHFEQVGCQVLYLARTSSRRWLRMEPGQRRIAFGKHGLAKNLPFIPLSGRRQLMNDLSMRAMRSSVRSFLLAAPAGKRVLWLQHPDYYPLAQAVAHDLLVYDAMDPFGAFAKTAPWVQAREQALLERADLVFTGGRSLHAQRQHQNPNVHCFPSGIDYPHFARAAEPGSVPEQLRAVGKPVLGYFGAIDRERLDWGLIERLCAARPDWQIVLIGPLVGMNRLPVTLPNLHHLGAKSYDELPDYLRGFDVALIPWQINDLTRFMSPTKTPEYLASGRPVVSTPIPDVIGDYGDNVLVAGETSAFINACERAIAIGPGPARKPPAARTWEEIAGEMRGLMGEALSA